MAKRKPDYHAHLKLWTPWGTLDSSGKADFCIEQAFRQLPEDVREKLICTLTDWHNAHREGKPCA